ncbi:MAG TPA: hypothetical protein VIJ43_00030, partial [Burkholderiales bacterium]
AIGRASGEGRHEVPGFSAGKDGPDPPIKRPKYQKKPVALFETPPARRRDSKGGGGETPQTNSTPYHGATQ